MLFKKIFLKTDIVKINQLTFAPYTVWTTQTAHSLTYFLGGLDGKASVYNVGDPGSIPGLGRSPGEGNGNPLQYYCLENPMDRGAWWATVHGVAKSQTRLSDFTIRNMLGTNVVSAFHFSHAHFVHYRFWNNK